MTTGEEHFAHSRGIRPLIPRTRTLLLSLLIFVIAALLALVILPPIVDMRNAAVQAQLDHVQALSDTLTDTENSLQQMQADARGYVITQNLTFLERYHTTAAMLPTQTQELTIIGNEISPTFDDQIEDLITAIHRWQAENSAYQISLAEEGRLSDVVTEISIGESQIRFNAFRLQFQDLQNQLRTIQVELTAQINQVRMLQTMTSVVLGILGLLAMGVILTVFWRIVELMRALTTEQTHAAHLTNQLTTQLTAVEHQNYQLTVFHAVASAAAISLQPAEQINHVLTTIAHLLHLPEEAIWIAQSSGLDQEGTTESTLVQAVAHNHYVLIPDTHTSPMPPDSALVAQALGEARSGLVLPLHGRAQLFGALVLTADLPHAFDQTDMAFYTSLAAQVGLVLDNARLNAAAYTEQQRLQAILDHSPEGLVVAEAPDGRISLINQSARSLFGELGSDVNLHDHILAGRAYRPGGEPISANQLPLAATLADGIGRRHVEVIIAAPDGVRVPVLTTSVPLRNEQGQVTGAIAVFQDLRQLREVERLKSDFVALVSHELRTPLTAIKGCTETLLRSNGADDPLRVREFLQIIDDQGDRLQDLIDNLLSLSQVEAGTLRLRRMVVALPSLIQNVLRQQRERTAGLRIQADVPTDLYPVSADPRRLEQVLYNLLDNAQKFSPENSVITITAINQEHMVRVIVRDHGPGIPLDEQERVFERFYQVAQPDVVNPGGSGLGLAICKSLIEAQGGEIGIDNTVGCGAAIWFTLPALPQHTADAVQTERTVRQQVGGTHVLVVDDDPALRRILDRSLTDAGYIVQNVVESQAAIEAITRQPPDIVLLDLMLPGIDGFELCQQLRTWTNVPIMMLTARAAEHDIVRGLQSGADDYLTKPFRLSELVARIESILRRTQTQLETNGISFIQVDRLVIDLAQHHVTIDDQKITLTPTEYGILAYLAQHVGQVLTHAQILKAVWGDTYGAENNYLWVHIAHLRQKLEPDPKQPRYILTERGVGYRLAKN